MSKLVKLIMRSAVRAERNVLGTAEDSMFGAQRPL